MDSVSLTSCELARPILGPCRDRPLYVVTDRYGVSRLYCSRHVERGIRYSLLSGSALTMGLR